MAKKKRKPGGDSPKRPRRPRRPPADLPPELPDRRTLEGMLRQFGFSLPGASRGDTPLEQAQDLMYQAFEEGDERRRVELARQALALSPDCADAYVLLAEHAPNRKEALALYEQGVAAGERALGPEVFERDAGHFWGLLETRPYMRARLGLALQLWTAGRRDEAVTHLQDMLRLNPNDNQGVRYTLASLLLAQDRDDDLGRLLEQYPDEGSAAWAYTRALLEFRRHGDTPESRRLLKDVKKTNKYVPDYLTGREFPPAEQPPYYSPGDRSEALEYVGSFMAGWKATPGAVAWLRANEPAKKGTGQAPPAKGPQPAAVKRLAKLTQGGDVWQADWRELPIWITGGAEPARPWMLLINSLSDDRVLAHQILAEPPSAEQLWDTLAATMKKPLAGEPHRPAELHVRPDGRWETLRPSLAEAGVALMEHDSLALLDDMVRELGEHLAGGPQLPGLLDGAGVTPEMARRFYEAAAHFFRQAPWKKVGYESAIRVECDRFEGGPWYAVLMGQSGLTAGLALYDDLDLLQRMWAQEADDEANARATVATTVTFGEASETAVADVDAAKRHGWEVARPDAYPSVFHKDRGTATRPPRAWELELMEACLRAVPEFVNRRKQDDPTREEMTVTTALGERRLALSWVADDE